MEENREEQDAWEKKFFRKLGKLFLVVATILICMNVIGRIVYIGKSMKCEQVTGTVVSTQDRVSYIGRNPSYTYIVWVEYQPQGYPFAISISEENPKFNLSKGDEVIVLYQKSNVNKAYVAKKDWLTGFYLPENKSFTMPLVIAIVLIGMGFILYTNSPILDWYIKLFE